MGKDMDAKDKIENRPKRKQIIVAAMVVVLIIVAVVFLFFKKDVNGSPEACAINLVEGCSQRDVAKIKKSIHKNMWPDDDSEFLGGDYFDGPIEKTNRDIDIKSSSVLSVSSDYKKWIIDTENKVYKIDAKDVKVVRIELETSAKNKDDYIEVLCIEVDSLWYAVALRVAPMSFPR